MEYSQALVSNAHSSITIGSDVTATPLTTICELIGIIERIEAAYSDFPWQNIVSRIRKECYSGSNVPSRNMVPFTWDDLIDEQEALPPLQCPPVDIADIAALRNAEIIYAPQGDIAIAHLLTGVDTMNFPNVAGTFARHEMSGPAAATWSGDVGTGLVNCAAHAVLDDELEKTRGFFYQQFARPDNLRGDYDGIALADMKNLSASAPLSERLQTYYCSAADQGVLRRYHNFCRVSGFTVVNARLDQSTRTYISEQIKRFADGFNITNPILDSIKVKGNRNQGFSMTSPDRIQYHLDWFVNRFLQELEAGLSSEL